MNDIKHRHLFLIQIVLFLVECSSIIEFYLPMAWERTNNLIMFDDFSGSICAKNQ